MLFLCHLRSSFSSLRTLTPHATLTLTLVILNRVFPLSFVFCVNITLGNISLQTIPVSFNQTIKAAVPACTVILQTCAYTHTHTLPRRL